MSERRRFTADERQQVYEKFGGRCAYCGCEITIKGMQMDHVVPLHIGGADDISNLYPACRACNHYKSTYTVERFREIIERAYDTQMNCSATFRNLVRFGMVVRPRKDVKFWFERQRAGMSESIRLDYSNLVRTISIVFEESQSQIVKDNAFGINMGLDILNCHIGLELLTCYLRDIAKRAVEINDPVLIGLLKNLCILAETEDDNDIS